MRADIEPPTIQEFAEGARAWLSERVDLRSGDSGSRWGDGDDDVAIFPNLTPDKEREAMDHARSWQRQKFDAGYGAITQPAAYGGREFPQAYAAAYRRVEREFSVPPNHEALAVSLNLEVPTILALGNEDQRARLVRPMLRADLICCQMFSEPEAGSDLGSISLRAEQHSDHWTLNGQKVWTTGALFAELGYLIARTDARAPRQEALTAFVIPMDMPGIEVRPLRQMTGGTSFNEVFFNDVCVSDEWRLGEVGSGWRTAMLTLGFERAAAAGGARGGSTTMFDRLLGLARHLDRTNDPVVRQELARLHSMLEVRVLTSKRARVTIARDGTPGPEGSLGKLAYTNGLQQVAHVASLLLGPSLVADTGDWGTYAWSELVTGMPGMRIGGGTDEIQRNAIGERVLGLPREPRPGR